jgi:hypothetical protein
MTCQAFGVLDLEDTSRSRKTEQAWKEAERNKKSWLEVQDAYTLLKQLPRNLYTVNNFVDVWECDLVDVQAFSKFNDNYKYVYLPTVIDAFSKFLHIVPLKS